MKLTSNFKMPKTIKRNMATFVDPHARGVYKRQMLDALLDTQRQPRAANAKST